MEDDILSLQPWETHQIQIFYVAKKKVPSLYLYKDNFLLHVVAMATWKNDIGFNAEK